MNDMNALLRRIELTLDRQRKALAETEAQYEAIQKVIRGTSQTQAIIDEHKATVKK